METQSIAVMTLAVYAILTIVAAGDTKSAEAEEQDADLFCFSPITAGIFAGILGAVGKIISILRFGPI